jgi:hypothetical protein
VPTCWSIRKDVLFARDAAIPSAKLQITVYNETNGYLSSNNLNHWDEKAIEKFLLKEGVSMKKYIFITPEGLTYKPNCDRPDPDHMDMQIFSFDRTHTIDDTLNDLIELNQNVSGSKLDGPFSIRVEKESRKSIWLTEHKVPTSKAS